MSASCATTSASPSAQRRPAARRWHFAAQVRAQSERGLQRRCQRREEARDNAHEQGECQDPKVQRNLERDRGWQWQLHRNQGANQRPRQPDCDDRTKHAEDDAFDEHLPHDVDPARRWQDMR